MVYSKPAQGTADGAADTPADTEVEDDETAMVERDDEEVFERLCTTSQLEGCEELKAARQAIEDEQRLVREHLELYRSGVQRLAALLVVPVRSPDARIEAAATVNTKQPDGPQKIDVTVLVDYLSGLERHPNTEQLRQAFSALKEFNDILDAPDAYTDKVKSVIRSQMVELRLEALSDPLSVFIPVKDADIVINAKIPQGTVNYGLVTSTPGLKYLVVKEWSKPMTAALAISKALLKGTINIKEVKASSAKYSSSFNVPSRALCDELRAEVRLSVSGKPQRKWNPRRVK